MRVRTLAPAAVGLVLLIGLTACSGSENAGSSAGSSGAQRSDVASGSSSGGSARAPSTSGSGTAQQDAPTLVATAPRSRIYSGELTVSARHVATVADEAVTLAQRVGAEVDSDNRIGGSYPSADITLRVADLKSRVSTQLTTIGQIRQLIGRTNNLQAIVQLQQTLATQEVQLESLQAQQRELTDQVALATIKLHVDYQAVAAAKPQRHNGFAIGLVAGWHGLSSTVRVALTVLGALLPFLVVLAVVGVPALVLWRRRRRRRTPAVTT